MSSRVSPITLEIIKNALSTLADEMSIVMFRTAYSLTLRDGQDFSTAVCDKLGRFIAQGSTAGPIHLGSFPGVMSRLVEEYGETMRPGDVYIANDPYGAGGMHLPDVFIVKPIFQGERVVGYATTLGHQCDIGGLTPGSMNIFSREIYQEGLRIPLLKFYEAGEPNLTLHRMLEKNVRLPLEVLGDMRAQLAACNVCERGLLRIVEQYGADEFERYVEALHDNAERVMRQELSGLPNGVYEFEDWLDGLGEHPQPIRFKLALTVADGSVKLDWTGTSPQVEAAINAPVATTHSMAFASLRCLVREPIPNCQGFTRPIEVFAPEGTIVNPREPAACASRGIVAYRMLDVIFGALAQAAPERMPAACEGGPTALSFGGKRENGRPFVFFDAECGCWGARAECDGIGGVANLASNGNNQSTEVVEASVPIEITHYGLAPNSGGPGRHRGGYALTRGYRLLGESCSVDIRSDRRAVLPYGLRGGLPGTPSWNIVNPGPQQRLLPVCPMESLVLERNDVYFHVQPGGGGYGDPLERDPQKVLEDVESELLTADYASDVYGVVIRNGRIDEESTATRRAELAARGGSAGSYLKHFHRAIGIHSTDWRDLGVATGSPEVAER